MPLYTSKALHLKSIDYAQGLLFAYLYLAAISIKVTEHLRVLILPKIFLLVSMKALD